MCSLYPPKIHPKTLKMGYLYHREAQLSTVYAFHFCLIILTFKQVISTFGAIVYVDRLGRRKLLMGSIAVMGLGLATIAVCEVATMDGAGEC